MDLIEFIYMKRAEYFISQNQANDFIVPELNLDMMEDTIGLFKRLSNLIRYNFCFTMSCNATFLDRRAYRYMMNPCMNDITCLEEGGQLWTMQLLNDTLSVIMGKSIE